MFWNFTLMKFWVFSEARSAPDRQESLRGQLHNWYRRLVAWRPLSSTLIISLILCAAFLLRLAAYDHPLGHNGGDGFNDYLTASHALTYGEWPVLGPANDFLPGIKDSVFYYYFIVALTAIHNTPGFLNFCFILLQCATIAGIFAITRRLFGATPAVLAGCLAAFAPQLISKESDFLWQPYVMEPFIVLAIFLFIKGYQSASEILLALSLVTILAALGIHPSALGIMPLYILILSVAVYRLDGYAGIGKFALLGSATFALLFATSLLHPLRQNFFYIGSPASSHPTPLLEHIYPSVIVGQFGQTIVAFAYQFLFQSSSRVWHIPPEFFILTFSALCVSYFLSRGISRERKFALALLALCVVQQLFALAFLGAPHQMWELVPAQWATIALIATLTYEAVRHTRWLWPLWAALGILFLWSAGNNAYLDSVIVNISVFERPQQVVMDNAVTAISGEIEFIEKVHGYHDYRFFTIEALRQGNNPVLAAVFWEPLERRFGIPFVTMTYYGSYDFVPLNTSRYIFLACTRGEETLYTNGQCLDYFRTEHPSYAIEKTVYDDPLLSVFLTRNTGDASTGSVASPGT